MIEFTRAQRAQHQRAVGAVGEAGGLAELEAVEGGLLARRRARG